MPNFLILLISAGLFLIGCSGDKLTNSNDPKNGYYDYDNRKGSLANLYMTGYVNEPDSVGKRFDVWLFSKNLSNPDMLDSVRSDVLYFILYSDKADYLDTGTYTWKNENSQQPFTFSGGFFGLNYLSKITDTIKTAYDFSTCSLTIKRTLNKYEITFSGYLTNYKQVTGYYKGGFSSF